MSITDETDLVIQGAGVKSKSSLIIFGSVLLVIGALALWASIATTLISVLVAGALLIVGALFQAFLTVRSKNGSEVLAHVLLAALYGVAGLFLIMNPVGAAISLTSLLGVFFIAGGLIRVGSALYMRSTNWGWAVLSGVVTFVLGIFTMAYLPEMSSVLIGAAVAVDLIFLGTTMIGYGAALPSGRNVRRSPAWGQ